MKRTARSKFGKEQNKIAQGRFLDETLLKIPNHDQQRLSQFSPSALASICINRARLDPGIFVLQEVSCLDWRRLGSFGPSDFKACSPTLGPHPLYRSGLGPRMSSHETDNLGGTRTRWTNHSQNISLRFYLNSGQFAPSGVDLRQQGPTKPL